MLLIIDTSVIVWFSQEFLWVKYRDQYDVLLGCNTM
jgi:hypothetical protein